MSNNHGPASIDELLVTLTETSAKTASESTQALGEEIMALQAIYGPEKISLLNAPPSQADVTPRQPWQEGMRLRLCVKVDIESDSLPPASSEDETVEAISVRLAISLPPHYPASESPPQLQILSRFVGPFAVDTALFGEVLRVYLHSSEVSETREEAASGSISTSGVHWSSGEAVLFEGIELVRERIASWLQRKQQENHQLKIDDYTHAREEPSSTQSAGRDAPSSPVTSASQALSNKVKLISAPPITDRKSVFIGHVARITHPDQVPFILEEILADRRLSKASHPIINAWSCKTADGVVHRDCDDDGESAAGGRLAHLLDLLHVEDVLVVVTRFFGGVHLGPDRFKLINRAARDALELAGVVESGANK